MEVHDKGMTGAHDRIKKKVREMNKQKLGIVFDSLRVYPRARKERQRCSEEMENRLKWSNGGGICSLFF